jgi:hypothetical protein
MPASSRKDPQHRLPVRRDDLIQHRHIDIVEPVHVKAALARRVLAEPCQCLAALRCGDVVAIAARKIKRMLRLLRAEAGAHPVDRPAAFVDGAVLAKADDARPPYPRHLARDAPEQRIEDPRLLAPDGWFDAGDECLDRNAGDRGLPRLLRSSPSSP